MDQTDPEPVGARPGLALRIAGLDQRSDLPGDRARCRAEPAGDLVRSKRSLGGEQIEDRERPLRGGDTLT